MYHALSFCKPTKYTYTQLIVVLFCLTCLCVCISHWYPHWSPCGWALRLFRMRVAHHPLTTSIFALLIQLTSRAAHKTQKNPVLFVTTRAVGLAFVWGPVALWRWPVKVILLWKTARWETHLTYGARCGNFTVWVAHDALLLFSLRTFPPSCCKVCEVCWVWGEERWGSCSLAWLRQPGDRDESVNLYSTLIGHLRMTVNAGSQFWGFT